MILTVRRTLLRILLLAALLASVLSLASIATCLYGLVVPPIDSVRLTIRWWNVVNSAVEADMVWAVAILTALSVFPVASELILRRNFGRSPSPEMFFLRLLLLTLPLQSFRLLLLPAENGWLGMSWALGTTRVAWFGRFTGISAMLGISIFSGDIPFRQSSYVLGMGALASLGIAVMLPLDITQPLGNLLVRSSAQTALALACLSMEILAVLAMFGNAVARRNSSYHLLGVFLLCIVIGIDLVFFASVPTAVPGILLTTGGVFGFARQIRYIYQWI